MGEKDEAMGDNVKIAKKKKKCSELSTLFHSFRSPTHSNEKIKK